MKEQCFLVQETRRGRDVTVLRRDKTEHVALGWKEVVITSECRKMGRKCLGRMTLKGRDVWNARKEFKCPKIATINIIEKH